MATKGKPADVAPPSLCLLARCKHRGVARLHLVANSIVGAARPDEQSSGLPGPCAGGRLLPGRWSELSNRAAVTTATVA